MGQREDVRLTVGTVSRVPLIITPNFCPPVPRPPTYGVSGSVVSETFEYLRSEIVENMAGKRKRSDGKVVYKAKKKSAPVVRSANKIAISKGPFPKEMRVKLKYVDIVTASVPSGTTGYRAAYRANSVYDPDPLVGGVTAFGFGQWSNFYSRYTVVASKCTVRILDQDTGTAGTGTVTGLRGIAMRDSATPVPSPTYQNLICDEGAVHKGFDSYHANDTVSLKFDAAKYFGVKDILDSFDYSGSTGATIGTNPAIQAYYYTWIEQAPVSGAAAQSFQVETFIEYDVVFSQPVDFVNL